MNIKPQLSEIEINLKGELCEVVNFGSEIIEYRINGITQHFAFGIYFTFDIKAAR